ncbi:hypothetical protein PVAP13_9KG181385 [Panicum virgatum]|uniref:Uncharacterized protein n=1 Tax=Panicum virgatum TaxID=38727 RepID=A0A8T0NGL2_PANVG|nr:hypothetical protein PVAP13_9KG181385 [Panicum virgatum]
MPLVRGRSTRIPTDRRKRPCRFIVVPQSSSLPHTTHSTKSTGTPVLSPMGYGGSGASQGAPFQGTQFTIMTPATWTLGSQQFTGAGPSLYHPMPPPGGYQGVYYYPPTTTTSNTGVVSRQRRSLLRRLYTVVCYACPGR